jgi:hypothetical protein
VENNLKRFDMEKEFVPYELALRMKALDYNESCMAYYNKSKKLHFDKYTTSHWSSTCLAPTFSQAFRWFREKYDLNGFVGYLPNAKKWYSSYLDIKWSGREYMKVMETEDRGIRFETYEEAELACLKKLIEIVELKKEE